MIAQFFDTLASQIDDGSFMASYVEKCSSAVGIEGDDPRRSSSSLPSAAPAPAAAAAAASKSPDAAVGNLIDLS